MWRGRETEAQRSRGLNVVLSKLRDLIKTPFISKPVPLNYHLHILLALVPSHLTVIKIYDLVWPRSCCRAASADGLSSSGGPTGGSSRSHAAGIEESEPLHTHSCTNYLIMTTLMGKKQVSWTYKADVGSHYQAAWLKWATDGWGGEKKTKNSHIVSTFLPNCELLCCCVVWKRWFLPDRQTHGGKHGFLHVGEDVVQLRSGADVAQKHAVDLRSEILLGDGVILRQRTATRSHINSL